MCIPRLTKLKSRDTGATGERAGVRPEVVQPRSQPHLGPVTVEQPGAIDLDVEVLHAVDNEAGRWRVDVGRWPEAMVKSRGSRGLASPPGEEEDEQAV